MNLLKSLWAASNRTIWLFGVLAALSLAGSFSTYLEMITRERQLTQRMTDSAFWVNAKFSYETDSLVMALALFDGSKGQLDEIRLKYDIVLSRIGTIANSDLSPKLDDAYKLTFSRVREELQAMEPRLDALRGGDAAQVRGLEAF